jgi:hypothetical protein
MADNSQDNKYGKLKEKSIDARIDAVATSTSRSRKTFLIMTIICATINMALWNGYLSWVRGIALPRGIQTSSANPNLEDSDGISKTICTYTSNFRETVEDERLKQKKDLYRFKLEEFTNINLLFDSLKNSAEPTPYKKLYDKLIADNINNKDKSEINEQKLVEKFNSSLENPSLFNIEEFKELDDQNIFESETKKLTVQYPELLTQNEKKSERIKLVNKYFNRLIIEDILNSNKDLKKKLTEFTTPFSSNSNSGGINSNKNSTNNNSEVNSENIFSNINTKNVVKKFDDENSSVDKSNKNQERLVSEWVSSQTISISLLGIRLTTFDLSVLGSLSLIVVMFWLFFVFRRENRAIVPFIKEMYDESKKIEISANVDTGNEEFPIRENSEINSKMRANELTNFVFHSVANSNLFTDIANNDNPMRLVIFDKEFNEEFSTIEFERNFLNTVLTILGWILMGILGFFTWISYWNGQWFWTIICWITFLVVWQSKDFIEALLRTGRNFLINKFKEGQNNKYKKEIVAYCRKQENLCKELREHVKNKKLEAEDKKEIENLQNFYKEEFDLDCGLNLASPNYANIEKLIEREQKFHSQEIPDLLKKIENENKQIKESGSENVRNIKVKRKQLLDNIQTLESKIFNRAPKKSYQIFSEKNKFFGWNETLFGRAFMFIKNFKENIIYWFDDNRNEAHLPRAIFNFLLFLPSITIFFIILTDIASLFDYSAYRNPDFLLIQIVCENEPKTINTILFFDAIAVISFIMTTYLSARCKQFIDAESGSLHTFFKEVIVRDKNKS